MSPSEASKVCVFRIPRGCGRVFRGCDRWDDRIRVFSNGINIVQENEGISLIDDKGKSIVNVLSNGQISVFMSLLAAVVG